MTELGEPATAPPAPEAKKEPEKKLSVAYSKDAVRCGSEVVLHAVSENIPNGTAIKWEVKQEGKTIQAINGSINAGSARIDWVSKAQTDKRPEPTFALTGTAAGQNATAPKELNVSKYENVAAETKTIACSSGAFGWTGRFNIELHDGQITITVKIKLLNRQGPKPAASTDALPAIGDPVSALDKAAMKLDVEGKLSNKHLFHRTGCKRGDGCDCPKERGCCKIKVKVVVEFVESGQHHQVNLFQGPGRANATNWTRVKTRENSYAHETGHLLGWYDEYAGGAVGAAPRWKIEAPVVMNVGLTIPAEYYWDFRDWLKGKASAEAFTVLAP